MGLVKNKPEPGVCLGYSHANTSPSHLLECIIGFIFAFVISATMTGGMWSISQQNSRVIFQTTM